MEEVRFTELWSLRYFCLVMKPGWWRGPTPLKYRLIKWRVRGKT